MSNPDTTIYEALRTKLGREPTRGELNAECRRILEEATIERATKGALRSQRK